MVLEDTEWGVEASQEHYTLCRCGKSKNKPFCDGQHWDAGFKDPPDEDAGVPGGASEAR